MKVMSIFGTRPEMIKLWSTLKKLDELGFDHVMVHTGQNFTPELRDFFFQDLGLRASHRGIKTFHMEAGLRAWDKRMPEQRNRILIDHMCDFLLPFNRDHR